MKLRRARRGSISVVDAMPRGTILQLGGEETGRVLECTGCGPYSLTVRQWNRWDTLRVRGAAPWRRMRRRLRDWWLDRCDVRWCWRQCTVEDEDCNGWCARHAGRSAR